MAIPRKSKFFFFSLLLVLVFSQLAASDFTETLRESDRQEALLRKLEVLVSNLTDLATKLESKVSESPDNISKRRIRKKKSLNNAKDSAIEEEGYRDKSRPFSVTKFDPFWSERFQFVSAVKLDSDATSLHVLPFRDLEGQVKYFAVGDSKGRVYVLFRNGDVLIEFNSTIDSPITSMASYLSAYKNETFVVTGHHNGDVLFHRVYEGSSNEDWNSLVMENVGKFHGSEKGDDELAIRLLEIHHVGRKKYILVTDLSGKVRVFTETGSFHGSVLPTSKPLVFLKQRLLFLTETGAGSLDLRSMKVKESECEGLNHSLARTYLFDAMDRSKAYGFTSDGEMIYISLLGDIMNFKCRVRSKRKVQMENSDLAFQAIKGYFLVVNAEKAFVYNVSTHNYLRSGGPRLVFSTDLDEIRSSFLDPQGSDEISWEDKVRPPPLITSDRENLVVLGLGDGYVAVFKSRLPVYQNEPHTVLWSSPVLLFVLFLFGAWYFFAKKKDALTSWGGSPDEPFPSEVANPRAFVESSRRNDEMLGLGRYGPAASSSSRYSDGGNGGVSELRFRGSGVETSGFGKRRESLFCNSKVLDDEN